MNVKKLIITLPEERMVKLRDMAALLGTSPEEIARASIEDLLGRPEEDYERAAEYILQKNAELYSRLA
jgi:antitoxin FitA